MSNLNEKDKLRMKLRSQRREIADEDRQKWDKKIFENILSEIDLGKIKSLHCYIPMEDWREVDTWPLIKHVWQNYPDITVAAPRILENGQMDAVVITPDSTWGKHSTGISEPADGTVLPTDFEFDVIIVPTLGFDKDGFRLGAGGGFYDRFLKVYPSKTSLVGVCYEQGFVEKGFEHEDHDVRLHKVVTESKVYDFKK